MNGPGTSLVLPSILCLVGFAIGGVFGLGAPALGFGWGAIVGALVGGAAGGALKTVLQR